MSGGASESEFVARGAADGVCGGVTLVGYAGFSLSEVSVKLHMAHLPRPWEAEFWDNTQGSLMRLVWGPGLLGWKPENPN